MYRTRYRYIMNNIKQLNLCLYFKVHNTVTLNIQDVRL